MFPHVFGLQEKLRDPQPFAYIVLEPSESGQGHKTLYSIRHLPFGAAGQKEVEEEEVANVGNPWWNEVNFAAEMKSKSPLKRTHRRRSNYLLFSLLFDAHLEIMQMSIH